MLPHAGHTPAEVHQMVAHAYSVTADASNPMAHGFNNAFPAVDQADAVRLEAVYTDLGRGDIPKLSGVGRVTLRNRHVQAEAANEHNGTKPLGSGRAEGKQFMGAIEHDGFLKFANIPLEQVRSIVVHVASAAAGGLVEVHRGSPDGPVLGSATVEVNGDWEAFYAKEVELEPAAGRGDVFLVFRTRNTAAA